MGFWHSASPPAKRFSDLGTVMIGVGLDALAYLPMAFANQSWMGLRSRRPGRWLVLVLW